MRTLFVADAHLAAPDDVNYQLFLAFLRGLKDDVEALYIMGDLFDFWVGFPSQPFRQYDPVIEELERLVARGCRIVYFEGNHDFHMGAVFSERLRAEIHTGPVIRRLQGKQLYLCHGDQINAEDRSYRLLRSVLRSWPVTVSVRHFPPWLAEKIRQRLQKSSQAGYHCKTVRWDYRRIIADFSRQLMQQGCDGLVTGHFHLALLENLPESSFTMLSLGDWLGQFTYGEMEDGVLSLKIFAPSGLTS